MSINLKVYNNGDHTALVWLPADEKPIQDCRGFTIRRVVQGSPDTYLHGFVGFSDDDKLDPNAPWKHPVQRFMWWDYGVKPGQAVQYSVVPVTGDKSNLQLATASASALTQPITITGQMTPNISAYFNKGIVAAQWVSRVLDSLDKPPPKMADLIAETQAPKNALRNALSGLLRPQILQMLADVKKNNGEIYAALYELNDPELKAALKAFGKKCHLILANGAFSAKNGNDENKAVRAELRNVVDLYNRLVPTGHFAHNKFLVACDSAGRPQRVLSGSTNWTMTGLCTQANNGIAVNDAKLAQYFLDEWNLLKKAKNAYPTTLAKANGEATANVFNIDGGTITQWFAPTDKGEDLAYARKLINAAKQGILFLFFNPGIFVADDKPASKWTLLQNILFRHHEGTPDYDPSLYIRGVVNQEIAGDPFGENPVVMTGSHNLGFKASSKNDDNLMIIEGNRPLAAAYAANIIAIYQSYRWNAYVEAHRQDPKVWHGLVNRDDWQDGYLSGEELAELTFWMGAYQPAAAPQIKHVPEHISTAGGPAPTGTRRSRGPKKQAPTKIAAARQKRVVKTSSAKKVASKVAKTRR